jgi:lipoprotein LprG
MPIFRLARLLLVALILALGLCSNVAAALAADATATPDDSAHAILERASARLADTQTMQFDLEVDGDSWIDDSHTMRLISARGDLERPDKVDVEFQINLLGAQNVSIRMITIGKKSWTTDLLTGKWGPSPPEFGYNPAVLFDNQKGLGPVAGKLHDPEIAGTEKIGGREAWKITGTVDQKTIEPLTSGVIQGDEIAITLWVDQEKDNILRIDIAEPEIKGKDHPATWTMTLTGHDSDITIKAPDTGN